MLEILPPNNENFQIKIADIFQISAQNIDCGHSLEPPLQGCSNEYPQSMFLSRNKKNNVYPCKPQFYYKSGGLRWSKLYRHVFVIYEESQLERHYGFVLLCLIYSQTKLQYGEVDSMASACVVEHDQQL